MSRSLRKKEDKLLGTGIAKELHVVLWYQIVKQVEGKSLA
jgi:hypothetical protein